MLMLLAAAAFAAGDCDLESKGPDAKFEVSAPKDAQRTYLVLEIWTDSTSATWATEILEILAERQVPAVVLIPLPKGEVDDPQAELALRTSASDIHELGIYLGDGQIPVDPNEGPKEIRLLTKELSKLAGRPRSIATELPTRVAEAILGKSGFRNFLIQQGASTATPRPAVVFEGQPSLGVVFPPGPYAGPCGTAPLVGPFTVAAADRAAQTLHGASRSRGVGIVRVGLDGRRRSPNDAVVLARWLDEIVLPSSIKIASPNQARVIARQHFRTGDPADFDPTLTAGGRLVAVEDARVAATTMADVTSLPRVLDQDLTLTEAFLTFAKIAAGDVEGSVVRLGAIGGPRSNAATSLQGRTVFTKEEVTKSARALVASLPDDIPAALPVGDQLLNAGELLLLYASVVRGDEEPSTHPVESPEPNESGLGWGRSTLP
jgi:hypothetical protein